MSAFIVSNDTIRVIVTALVRHRGNTDPEAAGRILLLENTRSVNHRYSERKRAPKYEHAPYLESPVQVLKSLDCFEYQACEHKGWARSEARKLIARARIWAIGQLPGYDAAHWDL